VNKLNPETDGSTEPRVLSDGRKARLPFGIFFQLLTAAALVCGTARALPYSPIFNTVPSGSSLLREPE